MKCVSTTFIFDILLGGANPAPGMKLFTASATTMRLRISRIRHSLGFLHSSGCTVEAFVRNEACPQTEVLFVCTCEPLYKPVVSDRGTGRPIFCSNCCVEHSHDKSDNTVMICYVCCTQFCIVMYLIYHRTRDDLCQLPFFPVHHITCEHVNDKPS